MGIDEGTPVTEAYTSHGSRFTGKGRESDRGGRVTEERKPVAPTGIWQRVARALFDEEAVEEIFVHARNLVVGTLILAAGVHATRSGGGQQIPGVVDVGIAGYIVAAVGAVLILLDLTDGLRKLSRVKRPRLLQALTVTVYVFVSIRVAQFVFAFRVS